MKYLFLAYRNPGEWQAMPARKWDAFVKACQASDEALQAAGYLFAWGNILEKDAVTVRILNGELHLEQSSISEKDMQLVEFFIVIARDLNEAIRVASRMPQAQRGLVKIRLLPSL